jgi:hypothetical protein
MLDSAAGLSAGHKGIDSNRQDQHANDQETKTNLMMAESQQGDNANQGENDAHDRPNEPVCASKHTKFPP